MDKIINFYKPIGITPVQAIQAFRTIYKEYQNIKIGFAGRLDPLAHGVLLLMAGDANKEREKYLNLEKQYKFSVLFGITTDTYDYLGKFTLSSKLDIPLNLEKDLQKNLKSFVGEISLYYPPFSSKTINGRQLYKLSKQGKLKNEMLPKRNVYISDFNLISVESIPSRYVKKIILTNLKLIRGYFRQGKIIEAWQNFFEKYPNNKFTIANFSITCTTGTYVRSIANELGKELGCGGIAFEILRTRVGKFNIKHANKLIETKSISKLE